MEFMTIRQVAASCNVSYEAIRKSVSRYSKDLEGHITTEPHGKTIYLDEYAVIFLKERRRLHPVVARSTDQQEEIDTLRNNLEQSRIRYEELQAKLSQALEKVVSSQEQALQIQNKYLALIEQREHEAEQVRQQIETEIQKEVSAQVDKLEQQHEADVKTIEALRKELEVMRQHTSPTERNRSPLQALFRRKR